MKTACNCDQNSLNLNPLLANPSANDFHLTSSSPAINASTTLSSVATDYEGTPRPQGPAYDIGADEFGGAVSTPTPTPSASPLPIPGRIEAESYTSYFDTTTGNSGDYTLRGDNVDIKNTPEGPTIGWTANGEWLSYSVNVQASGSYTTRFRIANGMTSNASLHLELNGTNISGPITIPPTGSWNTQTTISGPNLNLTQGMHPLKVVFDQTPVDLNWMEFTQQATPTSAPTATPTACHQTPHPPPSPQATVLPGTSSQPMNCSSPPPAPPSQTQP